MTIKHTRAAQVWAEIERELADRGLHIRNDQRDRLIRLVGDFLVGRRAPAAAARVIENALPAPTTHVVHYRRAPRHRTARKHDRREEMIARVNDDHSALARMLERSCSRRTGYDGDDAVGY